MIQQQYDSSSMYEYVLMYSLVLISSFVRSAVVVLVLVFRPNPGYDSRTAFLLLYLAFSSPTSFDV